MDVVRAVPRQQWPASDERQGYTAIPGTLMDTRRMKRKSGALIYNLMAQKQNHEVLLGCEAVSQRFRLSR
jgi:hypothetical protein